MGNAIFFWDRVGNLTNVNYPASTDQRYVYDPLNWFTNMVDDVGTTKYVYTAGNLLLTEDGPWSSDTVTNSYVNRHRTSIGPKRVPINGGPVNAPPALVIPGPSVPPTFTPPELH